MPGGLTYTLDWAGGPGDSKEDVKWLDDHLRKHFDDTEQLSSKVSAVKLG